MPQDTLAPPLRDGTAVPSPAAPVTVFVCSTCTRAGDAEGAPGIGTMMEAAVRAVAGRAPDVRVQAVKCMASCSRAPVVAMRRAGGWSYLFGNLDPVADPEAIVEGARLFCGASDGLLPWRGRPDCLKRNMLGRLPPLDLRGELAR